jgi:hypothetical protein
MASRAVDGNFKGRLVRRPAFVGWTRDSDGWIVGDVAESEREVRRYPKILIVLPFGQVPRGKPPAGERAG